MRHCERACILDKGDLDVLVLNTLKICAMQ